MRVHLNPQTRAGMSVAMVIAQEAINHTTYGYKSRVPQPGEFLPVLHTINEGVFSFGGGIIVRPEVEPLPMEKCSRRQPEEWVVISAEVRFYRTKPDGSRDSEKTTEVWDRERLERLRVARPWQWPIVASADYLRDRERTRAGAAPRFRDIFDPGFSRPKPDGECPPEDATFGRELEGRQQDPGNPEACDPTLGLG